MKNVHISLLLFTMYVRNIVQLYTMVARDPIRVDLLQFLKGNGCDKDRMSNK